MVHRRIDNLPEQSQPPDSLREGEAFAQLLERHQQEIFRYIFSILLRFQDAEDIFQLTATTMWEKFSEFEPGTSFLAWGKSIARFKVLEFMRSHKSDRLFFSEEVIQHLAIWTSRQDEFDKTRAEALRSCQAKLPTSDQNLLSCCYGKGATIEQVAKQIGRPANSVRNSLTRIRRNLYICIERALTAGGYR